MMRFYASLYAFNVGAMIATFLAASMFEVPKLFDASLWFGIGALALYAGMWAQRRINERQG